ncbi:MAG TPA: FHA domain-containing protein [Tepidisphaeraceae bacterium]|jgi:pSer/pThr/pTyr-binding forkhead associated (FHA) protein
MPYLILADKKGEFDRRELRGRDVLVIGRAFDCDVCIRDIMLSRRHCRIEPFHDRWIVIDLGSKNGTHVGREAITRHVLRDGEVIRIGRTQICFRGGAFVPARSETPRRDVRPVDPIEALAGTVAGFQVVDMEEDSRVSGFPVPKPRPAEPWSYRHDGVHSIVTTMASTAWDTRLARRPVIVNRPTVDRSHLPRPTVPVRPPRTPVKVLSTWKVWTYVVLALGVGLASFGMIFLRSLL